MGRTVTVKTTTEDQIEDLKARVWTKDGVPPEVQYLVHAGKKIKDGDIVANYNIQAGDLIYRQLPISDALAGEKTFQSCSQSHSLLPLFLVGGQTTRPCPGTFFYSAARSASIPHARSDTCHGDFQCSFHQFRHLALAFTFPVPP